MSETLLVRHGETTWNAEGRVQGWAPVALSDRGRRQAEATADALADGDGIDGDVLADGDGIDAVVSSDLRRAVATAEPIASAIGVELETDPRLRERDFGAYQGLASENFFDRFPELDLLNEESEATSFTPESGESWIDVRDRVLAAGAALRDRGGRTVAVTHLNPIRILLGETRDLDLVRSLTEESVDNCSITAIDDGAVIRANDTTHLDGRLV